jgi:hypothetical protein
MSQIFVANVALSSDGTSRIDMPGAANVRITVGGANTIHMNPTRVVFPTGNVVVTNTLVVTGNTSLGNVAISGAATINSAPIYGQVLEITSALASSNIFINLSTYTQYTHFRILASGIVPTTDGTFLRMQVSTDGGTTYDGAAANYGYTGLGETSGLITNVNNSDTWIQINSTNHPMGNASNENLNFDMEIFSAGTSAVPTEFFWIIFGTNSTPHPGALINNGRRHSAQDTTHLRFFANSGTIANGTFRLIGLA